MTPEEPPPHPDVIPDPPPEPPGQKRGVRALQQLLRALPYLYLSEDLDTRDLAAELEAWLELVPANQARLLLWYGVLDRPYAEGVPAKLDPRYWRWRRGPRVDVNWRNVMRTQAQNELKASRDRDRDGADPDVWEMMRQRNGIDGPAFWCRRVARLKLETLPTWYLYLVDARKPPGANLDCTDLAEDTKVNNSRARAYRKALADLAGELRARGRDFSSFYSHLQGKPPGPEATDEHCNGEATPGPPPDDRAVPR